MFTGTYTAIVTPFTETGEVDSRALAALVEFQIDGGVDGIVAVGTTGESPTLNVDEHLRVIREIMRRASGRVKVLAGTGANSTQEALELTREAAAMGCDGTLQVMPYYNKPNDSGLLKHFTAVADTLLRLAEHPRIVAVKDAKGDLWAATHVMAATDLQWYSGDDVLNLAHLAQGAVGVVSVVGHVAGDEYAAMIRAVEAGDLATARAIHHRLIPVVDALMNTSQGAIMAKAALVELGVIPSAFVRLPLVESPPEHLAKLREGLSQSGIR